MPVGYLLARVGMFLLVIWLAASIIFVIPRIARGSPVQNQAAQERFGLDRPIAEQYGSYLLDAIRLDLGPSIVYFPSEVGRHIQMRLPWSIGLLTISSTAAFILGNLLGAVLGWPGAPHRLRMLTPLLMPLMGIPYYLLGLILVFLFSFTWPIFPPGGGYSMATNVELSPAFVIDVIHHGTLPAISIVLASAGFWTITMRAMMITNLDDDYMILAEAKGLAPMRIFFRYAMRNAMLPQVTMMAITFGQIVSGSLLVEVIFDYPGMGWILREAIRHNDYALIQGLGFVLVLAVAGAMLILDLLTPLVDRRIVYGRHG